MDRADIVPLPRGNEVYITVDATRKPGLLTDNITLSIEGLPYGMTYGGDVFMRMAPTRGGCG